MNSNQTRQSANTVLGIAGAVGLIALILFLVVGGWGFWASFFVALILAAVVFAVLLYGFNQGGGAGAEEGTTGAPPAPQVEEKTPVPPAEPAEPAPAEPAEPAPAAASKATAAPSRAAEAGPEPAVKPSKALSGQADLAGRKGEWKYQGEGARPAPAAAAPAAGEKPAMLSEARAEGADDLKRIKGIGPKLEKMLNGMGVYHFDQIAAWTDKEVAWVDENLEGFKGRVSRDNWVGQAKALSGGG